ncbi:MAG: type II toxin-antitoxin system VapC family toxin [Campylobacterales bacterium]|nr:type II toxin-antitoxin system VapC family toxin [Campylobacterales bacterium]
MNNNIFLDVNIVLDFLDTTRPFSGLANELMYKLLHQESNIMISEDMVTTIFYLSPNKSKTLKFLSSIQKKWDICDFGTIVIEDAINLSLEKNLDLEDVLQCLCAKNNRCDVLITNDKKFYDCGVKIMSTKEFLDEK